MRNVMTLRFSIALLLITLTIQSYSQVDLGIHRQKLNPTFIDTTKENVFVYEVPNAILYFKQDDIKKFINNSDNKGVLSNYGYKTLLDTLTKTTRQIIITDFYFYYDQEKRDSIFKEHPEDLTKKRLTEEFYFIGAGLILKGKFMVYSKDKKAFIIKGLKAEKRKGYLGQETLDFYLPNKKRFYSIITALGE